MTRLLITRPRPQADETARLVKHLGYEPVVEPLLTIEFIKSDPPDGIVDGAVITSIHAVSSLLEIVALPDRDRFPVLAVGETTRSELNSKGFANVASASGSALDLVNLAPEYFSSQLGKKTSRIIYPSADITAHNLTELTRNSPINITTWPVYRAVAATSFSQNVSGVISAGGIHGVLLYSARTAQTFWNLFTGLEKSRSQNLPIPTIYCLSQAIADTFPENRHIDLKVACHPSQESLVKLLNS